MQLYATQWSWNMCFGYTTKNQLLDHNKEHNCHGVIKGKNPRINWHTFRPAIIKVHSFLMISLLSSRHAMCVWSNSNDLYLNIRLISKKSFSILGRSFSATRNHFLPLEIIFYFQNIISSDQKSFSVLGTSFSSTRNHFLQPEIIFCFQNIIFSCQKSFS